MGCRTYVLPCRGGIGSLVIATGKVSAPPGLDMCQRFSTFDLRIHVGSDHVGTTELRVVENNGVYVYVYVYL